MSVSYTDTRPLCSRAQARSVSRLGRPRREAACPVRLAGGGGRLRSALQGLLPADGLPAVPTKRRVRSISLDLHQLPAAHSAHDPSQVQIDLKTGRAWLAPTFKTASRLCREGGSPLRCVSVPRREAA